MAKRKRENTPEKIEKKLNEGFGQGIGREYKPWLTIQEVPSQGRVTRLSGIKIDRQHDLMSDLERNYFYSRICRLYKRYSRAVSPFTPGTDGNYC